MDFATLTWRLPDQILTIEVGPTFFCILYSHGSQACERLSCLLSPNFDHFSLTPKGSGENCEGDQSRAGDQKKGKNSLKFLVLSRQSFIRLISWETYKNTSKIMSFFENYMNYFLKVKNTVYNPVRLFN